MKDDELVDYARTETLLERGRFAFWLQRIVRNHAIMKLRRGGPNGTESSFAVMQPQCASRFDQRDGGSDLDRLLFRMSSRLDEEPFVCQDPQVRIMRKEL